MNSVGRQPVFAEAVEATGKKNIVIAGLWTEVCVAWPTVTCVRQGLQVFVVEDAAVPPRQAAQDSLALKRMVQAGAARMTTVPTSARVPTRLGATGTLRRPHGNS